MTVMTGHDKWKEISDNRTLTHNLFGNQSRVPNHSLCCNECRRVRPCSVTTSFPIFASSSNSGTTRESQICFPNQSQRMHPLPVSCLQLLHQWLSMGFLFFHFPQPALSVYQTQVMVADFCALTSYE